jgi:hypothetical protein
VAAFDELWLARPGTESLGLRSTPLLFALLPSPGLGTSRASGRGPSSREAGLRVNGSGAGDDEDARGRVNPFSLVVDAGVGANGPDDGVRGDFDFVNALEQAFQDEAKIPAAAGEEPGGVGVTVDGRAAGEVVVDGNVGGAVPMDEGFLDGLAVGVMADAALELVAAGRAELVWPFGLASLGLVREGQRRCIELAHRIC